MQLESFLVAAGLTTAQRSHDSSTSNWAWQIIGYLSAHSVVSDICDDSRWMQTTAQNGHHVVPESVCPCLGFQSFQSLFGSSLELSRRRPRL